MTELSDYKRMVERPMREQYATREAFLTQRLAERGEEVERLRAALIEVREQLFSDDNPLHAIENALVPLDHALNQEVAPR